MTVEPTTLAAIVTMALITYGTRTAGLFLAGGLKLEGRAQAAFDAIPPAVLVAVIAPSVTAGPAEMIAAVLTIIAATRLPLLATVVVGVVSVVVLRGVF